uniref:1-deoxy-D-xylulose-5-phosphate synthase n=1 Tax=uncultured bacterium Contigcl_1769 TaxID=1393659 RepID=W0FT27_9BACT|nr:deoxyxylulose-5-phosphate synthase [uncultured bacterium Contigcl_1769]
MSRILDAISSPDDLKPLSDEELQTLAGEIREQIIATTSRTGGHVASSLGAVEIILAVHSLIDSPKDRFVFDVGHQAYAHKLVTGRLEAFDLLRQVGGVSGFPRPDESPHDVHPSGHASDSLSVALGLVKARELRGSDEKVVALIGDAALAGGMAFEALNTIGQLQLPLVIILNDNEMSISRNVGALVRHLGAMRSSASYRQARDQSQERLEESGPLGRAFVNFGRNAKESIKHFFVPETMMFEQLGILCTPPIDGHDIGAIKKILETALDSDGPVLMHVVTRKGAGYAPAEADPERFHGVGPYDIATGESTQKPCCAHSYTDVFGEALVREARADERIVAMTAGMRSGTGLGGFSDEFPERFVDVGIAEENAVGMAAGLAFGGMKPVVAIYSTFLQRAIDQMVVDAALASCDIVFAIDRAGLVGDDGPTHHGAYDISYCRMIPGMRVLAPSDEAELACALHTALQLGGPFAVRYPRGAGVGASVPVNPRTLTVGESRTVREGSDVAILAFGDRVVPALEAAEILAEQGVDARVVDMRWVKPLDEEAIAAAAETRLVVTVENGIIAGGAGEAVLQVLSRRGMSVSARTLGIDDRHVPHGKPEQLLADLGLDAAGIAAAVLEALE